MAHPFLCSEMNCTCRILALLKVTLDYMANQKELYPCPKSKNDVCLYIQLVELTLAQMHQSGHLQKKCLQSLSKILKWS